MEEFRGPFLTSELTTLSRELAELCGEFGIAGWSCAILGHNTKTLDSDIFVLLFQRFDQGSGLISTNVLILISKLSIQRVGVVRVLIPSSELVCCSESIKLAS